MTDDEIQEEIDRLIGHPRLVWLLGAGASYASGLPLIVGLTYRVREIASNSEDLQIAPGTTVTIKKFLDSIANSLPDPPNIERILDQICDYLAMAKRSVLRTVHTSFGNLNYDELDRLRLLILDAIRDAVRFGYIHDSDPLKCKAGSANEPIVSISSHILFVRALFGDIQASRPRAAPVELFTTNYDTLIEDALSLCEIPHTDYFSGGSVAYWTGSIRDGSAHRARVTKLHGSIDWARTEDGKIVRRRLESAYPSKTTDLLIYPQSSKYDFARREPYDSMFHEFRTTLTQNHAQVLLVCGYSFGDDHIDAEIERALQSPGSQLTLVIFTKEPNAKLKLWQSQPFGERIYIVSESGVFRGASGPLCVPKHGYHDWWTFDGMTKRIRSAATSFGVVR